MLQQQDSTLTQFVVQVRAILYARFSGDDRKNATSSIKSQLGICRKYANDRGYNIIAELFEEPNKSTSGYDMLPELEKILELAQNKAFDVLIVKEIDRLARNKFKWMSIENTLDQHGIKVEYAVGQYDDTDEGRLLKGMMSEFAEYERAKIRQRIIRGKLDSTRKGNVLVGGAIAPFGYDIQEVNGIKTLIPNEYESSIVRLIFDLYVNKRYSLNGLADYLNDHNIPKPAKANFHKKLSKGKGWSTGTLSAIITNETYIGRWYYGKTKSVKDKLTGKRRHVKRPKNEWLLINIEPIINEAVFNIAQERKEANKRQAPKGTKRVYILGGMQKCGHCNSTIAGRTLKRGGVSYYKCGAANSPKRYGFKCENSKMYRAEKVEAVVWQWVKDILLDEDYLNQTLEKFNQKQLETKQPLLQMIEANKAKLTEHQSELQRLIDGYTAGVFTLDEIAPKKAAIDKSINNLNEAIEKLQDELGPNILTDEELAFIKDCAKELAKGAEKAENNPTAKRKLFQVLRLEAVLSRDNEGKEWVDTKCVLGEEHLSTDYNAKYCDVTCCILRARLEII